jgi:hypothetical protein
MFEIFSSIGVIGIVMLIVGFSVIWWLEQLINNKDLFDDGDRDD